MGMFEVQLNDFLRRLTRTLSSSPVSGSEVLVPLSLYLGSSILPCFQPSLAGYPMLSQVGLPSTFSGFGPPPRPPAAAGPADSRPYPTATMNATPAASRRRRGVCSVINAPCSALSGR